MNKFLLLSIFATLLLASSVFSQQKKPSFPKNQIGIQLNPYLDKNLFNGLMHPIIGIRFGRKFVEPMMVGVEASGNLSYFFHHDDHIPAYSICAGLFTRYSIPSEKRIQVFMEASPYLSHTFIKQYKSSYYDYPELVINKFGIYIAPGISLYSKSKKISFDVYYKFSNLRNFDGHKSVVSYKLNFNF